MQVVFNLLVLCFVLVAANRWRELEQEWTEAKYPFLSQKNEELNIWLQIPEFDEDDKPSIRQIASRGMSIARKYVDR